LNEPITVEIVACRTTDVRNALAGGANRIELVSSIEVGGLTPSYGSVASAMDVGLPLIIMLRPRPGGFDYDSDDLDTMRRDVSSLAKLPVLGFITGCLHSNGELNLDAMSALKAEAPHLRWACHRAFDAVPDPLKALESCIEIGFDAILTSGGQPRAADALDSIRELVHRSSGRIEILPAGGIRPDNVRTIIKHTGVRSVHLAPFSWAPDSSTSRAIRNGIAYGPKEVPREEVFREIDASAVEAVVTAVTESR
jgi:copper homeostasis protein